MAQALLGRNTLEDIAQRSPGDLRHLLHEYNQHFELYAVDATADPRFSAAAAQSLLDQAPADLVLAPKYVDCRAAFDAVAHHHWRQANQPLLDDLRCGPVQISWHGPWTSPSEKALEQTLQALWETLPSRGKLAVEFRDPSWFRGDALRMMEENGAGLVWSARAGLVPYKVTSDIITIRLTGQTTRRMPDEVGAFLGRLRDRLDRRDVHVISSAPGHYGVRALERFARGIGHPLRVPNKGQAVLERFGTSIGRAVPVA